MGCPALHGHGFIKRNGNRRHDRIIGPNSGSRVAAAREQNRIKAGVRSEGLLKCAKNVRKILDAIGAFW